MRVGRSKTIARNMAADGTKIMSEDDGFPNVGRLRSIGVYKERRSPLNLIWPAFEKQKPSGAVGHRRESGEVLRRTFEVRLGQYKPMVQP